MSAPASQRYARQIMLPQLGGAGQKKLQQARVLVVGAGGLAAGLLPWLVGAGIGHIGIMDNDVVELSNLHRQTLFRDSDIGQAKTPLLATRLGALNPDCTLVALEERLTPANAMAHVENYDIVADGSDNFATRFLLNDACYFAKRVLVSAALAPMQGQLTTLAAFRTQADGTPHPCYRSLVPDISPDISKAQNAPCAGLAVLGALAGVMGSLQAMEIIKEIVGMGDSLVGKLLLYDALSAETRLVQMAWDPANPLNGRQPRWHNLDHHATHGAP